MKKIIYILAATALILTGCERSPHADFTVSNYVVEVGEDVYFYNNSIDAFDFEWDFGDEYASYSDNPVHSYLSPGSYRVTLAAFDDDEVDYAYAYIDVVQPTPPPPSNTVLEILVLEYYDEYPVPDASIFLYPTYEDWLNQTNPVIEVFTDAEGWAVIEDLPPVNYYLDVWHENHDNYALADEDINFIKVSGMVAGAINTFTAYVDYVEVLQSAGKERTRRKSTNVEKRKYIPTK